MTTEPALRGADSGTGEDPVSLVELLGEQRAAIVEHLRRHAGATVGDLAEVLGISEVATRRHVAVLEEDGFVAARTVNQGRGRPAARYELTAKARALYPQRYAAVASELMEFITSEHGREGLRSYLRWRLERESEAYAEAVTGSDLRDRLEQLAEALSAAGYEATVRAVGDGYVLEQDHCAIYEVARHHPEMCAYEAATFSRVLGDDVSLRRRLTLAGGAPACVCTVSPRGHHDRPAPTDRPSGTDTRSAT